MPVGPDELFKIFAFYLMAKKVGRKSNRHDCEEIVMYLKSPSARVYSHASYQKYYAGALYIDDSCNFGIIVVSTNSTFVADVAEKHVICNNRKN